MITRQTAVEAMQSKLGSYPYYVEGVYHESVSEDNDGGSVGSWEGSVYDLRDGSYVGSVSMADDGFSEPCIQWG